MPQHSGQGRGSDSKVRSAPGFGRVLVDPHLEGTFSSAVLADPSGATFSINQLMLTAY